MKEEGIQRQIELCGESRIGYAYASKNEGKRREIEGALRQIPFLTLVGAQPTLRARATPQLWLHTRASTSEALAVGLSTRWSFDQ